VNLLQFSERVIFLPESQELLFLGGKIDFVRYFFERHPSS